MKLTETQLVYLKLYTPQCHGIALPRRIARQLITKGLVEWRKIGSWSGTYAITSAGRAAINEDAR